MVPVISAFLNMQHKMLQIFNVSAQVIANSENGNCNICLNVEKPSVFYADYDVINQCII
jgi:hypothetical protein